MLQKIFILLSMICPLLAQNDGAIPISDITIHKVTITPAQPEVFPGETIYFKFQAFTKEGKEVPAAFTWRFSGGKLHHDGRFIAGERPGKYTMEAEAPNGIKGTATIIIKEIYKQDHTPKYLKISPERIHLQPGQKCQFKFGAYNRHGEKVPAPLQISFGGGQLDTKGNFIAGDKHGRYKFIVSTESGLTAEAKVFVGDVATSERDPVYIKVTPARISLFPGEKTKFQFTAYDKLGEQVDCSLAISYAGGKINSAGEFVAGNTPGRYEFKVISDNKIEGVAKIHIMKQQNATNSNTTDNSNNQTTPKDPKIHTLTIFPRFTSLKPGEKQQFSIKAYNKNGEEVTPQAGIQFSGGKFTPDGTYTAGERSGTYKIILTSPEGIKAEAKIEIIGKEPVVTKVNLDL